MNLTFQLTCYWLSFSLKQKTIFIVVCEINNWIAQVSYLSIEEVYDSLA